MSRKISVPKRIAGAKLDKELRRSLRELGGSKAGRARVATGLAALAAALASTPEVAPPKRRRTTPAASDLAAQRVADEAVERFAGSPDGASAAP